VVEQAPALDTDWYDAIIVVHGPIQQLRQETYDGVIDAEVYASGHLA
jgi:hypothetical protein